MVFELHRVSDAEEDKQLMLLGQTGPGIIRLNSQIETDSRVSTYQMSPWMFSLLGGAILDDRLNFLQLQVFQGKGSTGGRGPLYNSSYTIQWLMLGSVETKERPSVTH